MMTRSLTPFRFTYTRSDADKIVGGDVRQFARNQESFAELVEIVKMLDTDKAKASITNIGGIDSPAQILFLRTINQKIMHTTVTNWFCILEILQMKKYAIS